jgi:Flp pilus assembly CpaF family ATPase
MSSKPTRFQRKAQERQNIIQETVDRVDAMQSLKVTEDEQAIVAQLMQEVSHNYADAISEKGITEEIAGEITAHVRSQLKDSVDDFETQRRLEKVVTSTIQGLGPIQIYADDPDVEDIVVQRYDNIVIVKGGRRYNVDASFKDEESLVTVINRIVSEVNRQINMQTPMVDAWLADGSRVNATIPPVSKDASLTIRKHKIGGFTADDYLEYGCLNDDMMEFLQKAVTGRLNIFVSGGTGSGKTTLLNMLSSYIPDSDELIVTVEDTRELQLKQRNVRSLVSRQSADSKNRITLRELIVNALRMTVDRIVVGEVRDGTVVDAFNAMSTGHEGSLTTGHANSPSNLVNSRFPIMYSQYEYGSFTDKGQMMQIAESLDLIIQIQRLRVKGEKKGRRVITHITAVDGVDKSGNVKLVDIFRYNETSDDFYATGYVPQKLLRQMEGNGVHVGKDMFVDTRETTEPARNEANDELIKIAAGQGPKEQEPKQTLSSDTHTGMLLGTEQYASYVELGISDTLAEQANSAYEQKPVFYATAPAKIINTYQPPATESVASSAVAVSTVQEYVVTAGSGYDTANSGTQPGQALYTQPPVTPNPTRTSGSNFVGDESENDEGDDKNSEEWPKVDYANYDIG